MKKKILLITCIISTISILSIIIFNNMDTKENNIISNVEKNKQVITNNMITMMYETEAGSGEYTETTDNTWPETGYIFNDVLSGCENGGELEYNSQNNTVNLLSNSSDTCYVYFDKYDGVWIDNVSITNITGSSVTLTVDATSENGSITTYYYALNDSEEYQQSSSNIITINNLNKLTEYNIKIYSVDNTGARSNIYETNVSTTDESKPVINSVSVSNITTNGFTLTVDATSDIEIEKYYFTIDGEGEYNAGTSTNNSYTFRTLNENINYNVMIFIEDIAGSFSQKYSIEVHTSKKPTLAEYIKSLYTSQGSNGLYYHTSSLANSARDNSYRYSGSNPNNYVCFGTESNSCPEENLYRIIGIFGDEVKLIKADYTTVNQTGSNYAYVDTYQNTWEWEGTADYDGGLLFADIATYNWNYNLFDYNINNIFLNSYDIIWREKISSHNWKKNGISYNRILDGIPSQVYNYEIGTSSSGTTYSAKMSLMYVSDYGFAASPNYWTKILGNNYGEGGDYSDAKNNNWMYMGLMEWTISYRSDSDSAFNITNNATVHNYDMGHQYYGQAIRPCFYLNSDVMYVSGNGSINSPFRIE